MARPKIGDIIEIETSKGLAYALYTHEHTDPPRWGSLLRVFERLYGSRPHSLADIVRDHVRFSTFFPLSGALKLGIVKNIGNVPLPEELRRFPIFRDGNPDPRTNEVKIWWLWDGEKEVRVGDLTPEQLHYPLRELWNDTMLIERIEEDWRPENEGCTVVDAKSDVPHESNSASATRGLHSFEHYLYFPNENVGTEVAKQLRSQGFDVEDRLGADDENWLVLVKTEGAPDSETLENTRSTLESIAEEHGGEYDGWQASVC